MRHSWQVLAAVGFPGGGGGGPGRPGGGGEGGRAGGGGGRRGGRSPPPRGNPRPRAPRAPPRRGPRPGPPASRPTTSLPSSPAYTADGIIDAPSMSRTRAARPCAASTATVLDVPRSTDSTLTTAPRFRETTGSL